MKRKTRYICILLAVIMIMSICGAAPFSVSAAEAEDVSTVDTGGYPEIKLGETKKVTVEIPGDWVYLRFVPERDMRIVFYSTSELDTYGAVSGYHDDGMMGYEVYEYDDNSGEGDNFRVISEVYEKDSSYILKVTAPYQSGSFDVTVEEYSDIWSYTDTNNDDGVIITGYYGTDTEVEIPSELDGKSVKEIGEDAFFNAGLKKVVFPDSVETIDRYAFRGCSDLQEIELGTNVSYIAERAFDGTALTNVDIPDSVTSIGSCAFLACDLTSVNIPDSVRYIGSYAFGYTDDSDEKKVEGFTISGKDGTAAQTYAEENGFTFVSLGTVEKSGTTGDCTWTLEGSVLTVSGNGEMGDYDIWRDSAPWGKNITELNIEPGVTMIGSGAFYDCQKLTNISIPDTVTSIGDDAFWSCTGLTSVSLSDSVEEIGYTAFFNCDNLKSITIPNSVTWIGSAAFGCYDEMEYFRYEDFTIYGYEGSAAEMYAGDNGFAFVALEIPEHTITTGERMTASESIANYLYTPEKDMLVYFHAIGASGAFGSFSGQNNLNRSILYPVEAGKTYTLLVKKEKNVDRDYSATYEGYDFVIEEIPVEDAVLGETVQCEYRSPLAYSDALPTADILWPDIGHIITNLPMKVLRYTASEDHRLNIDFENGGVYKQEPQLYDAGMNKVSFDPMGISKAKVKAGSTYYVVIYSSDQVLETCTGDPYTVTLNRVDVQKLVEGHNILVQKAGSGAALYEFDVPRSAYWKFTCPGAVSYEDIVLVYNGLYRGTDFPLDEVMSCDNGYVEVRLAANDSKKDKTYDLNIEEYLRQIPLYETTQVTVDAKNAVYGFAVEKPMLIEAQIDAAFNASSEGVYYSCFVTHYNQSVGLKTTVMNRRLQKGKNSFRLFAMPGATYYFNFSGRDKETGEVISSVLDITLKDASDEIEPLLPGVEKNFVVPVEEYRVYAFTPSEACLITVESTAERSASLCTEDNEVIVIAGKDRTGSYACKANVTYYIYYYNNGAFDEEGTIKLTQQPMRVGDADGDGEITVMDVTAIQYSLSLLKTNITEETLMNGDVDKNGLLEIVDATFIQRYLAEIDIPYEIG